MKHHFQFILLIVLLLLSLAVTQPLAARQTSGPPQIGLRPDAPTYAMHGPYWVGTRSFPTQTDSHPTTVQVWYPALNPAGTTEEITYEYDMSGHALESAQPDVERGPYPLVIYAHGGWGMRVVASYLTEHLASWGVVVMAIDYGDNMKTAAQGVPIYPTIYTRPRDVSWQLDYAASLTADGGRLAGMINTDHVAYYRTLMGRIHGFCRQRSANRC
jgi:predicted dienelactone hydrolase